MKDKDGRKVKSFTQIIEGLLHIRNIGHYNDEIKYIYDYRGEYSLGWLACYKDGKEIQRTSDKFVDCIVWLDSE